MFLSVLETRELCVQEQDVIIRSNTVVWYLPILCRLYQDFKTDSW